MDTERIVIKDVQNPKDSELIKAVFTIRLIDLQIGNLILGIRCAGILL